MGGGRSDEIIEDVCQKTPPCEEEEGTADEGRGSWWVAWFQIKCSSPDCNSWLLRNVVI